MQFSALEKKVFQCVEDTIKLLGFELVLVNFKKDHTLRVVVDRLDRSSLSVKDCKEISNNISPLLDVEGILGNKSYTLEVASAGLERPLVKLEDYKRFKGEQIAVELFNPINTRKKYQGELLDVRNDSISLRMNVKKSDLKQEIEITFQMIKFAHLVLTKEKFRQYLKVN